jgi:hypothetical protein
VGFTFSCVSAKSNNIRKRKRKLIESCKFFEGHGTVCENVRRRKKRRSYERSIREVKDEILKVSVTDR